MKILAFDQASIKTAWSFFYNSDLVEYDLIHVKNEDNDLKFIEMLAEICKVINDKKPDVLIFEDVSLQTNVSTLVQLSRIQGCIISECIRQGICYYIYKPSEWRKILKFTQGRGVKRKQLKQQAIDYVSKTFNIHNVGDDLSEAICIGLAHIQERNNDFKETK